MAPKIEMGTWNSVKRERVTFAERDSNKGQKQKVISPIELVTVVSFFGIGHRVK